MVAFTLDVDEGAPRARVVSFPAGPGAAGSYARRLGPWLILAALLLPAARARGSEPPQAGASPVVAIRLTRCVCVDGLLQEPVWRQPPSLSRLTQERPFEGAAPSESTWVWIAYDDDALYLAARMWDSRPDSIAAPLARRDTDAPADFAGLLLDPFDDHRTGYEFVVTAAGELMDATLYNDGAEDPSWDGVWDARAQTDERGWTCEMRIPFSQLRYTPGEHPVWGVDFVRRIVRRAEKDFLVYTPKAGSGFVSRFPHLVGLDLARRRRPLEIAPYVTGKTEVLARAAEDPFARRARFTPQSGGDLRMGAGSGLTLNATVNPDFGQVEVDPAVVNLSDVESFFEEKRPFFTENAAAFRFGREGSNTYISGNWPDPTFFYSRRIGRAPQGRIPAGAEFSDAPVATHILGAGKLTGRPAPGLSIGVLGALTGREEARYAVGGTSSRAEIEPPAFYGVARALEQSRSGDNGLGLISTVAERDLEDPAIARQVNRQSLALGVDGWHFLDRRKVWVVTAWAAASRVAGTPEQMIAIQRSSRHYWQRPDAARLGVDSSATALVGYAGRVMVNRQEGNTLFNAALGVLSPGFEVNDLGYQTRSNLIQMHVCPGYHFTRPSSWRRDAIVRGLLFQGFDYDGERTDAGAYLTTTTTFANDWTLTTETMVCPRITNVFRSRGGPRMAEPPGTYVALDLSTADRERLVYGFHVDRTYTPAANGTDYWTLAPSVSWKPAARVEIGAGPTLQRVIEDAQHVGKIAAPGEVPADFGGLRYVFARMDQTTVGVELRINLSFTRDLTLQTYVQPLISAGRFSDFKELAHAGSYEFVHYGKDGGSAWVNGVVTPAGGGTPFTLADPSFNLKSLRGNAVLRWEYRSGSVLYFIWTQQRSDEEAMGELRLGRSTRRLFDASADNLFLVKATYRLAL